MEYRIIPDFLTALARLSKTDQKSVRDTIDTIIKNYEGSGLRFHKINHPSSAVFSYSVNRDVRIIVHRKDSLITLLYVDHHDVAYSWVNRRKFVATDTILRIISVESVEAEDHQKPPPSDAILAVLKGIEEYKQKLAHMMNDDEVLEFIAELPIDEAAKSDLLEYAVQKSRRYSILPAYLVKPLDDDEDLAEALNYPLDLWRVFLHPIQEAVVSLPINSSRFITGGPGTGKTVCLVHRIKKSVDQLNENQKVLLITYKKQLSGYIFEMLHKLTVDTSKIVLADVTEMNEASVINVTSKVIRQSGSQNDREAWRNCFVIDNSILYFYEDKAIQLSHIFVDEYQDFRSQQLEIIHQLIEIVPFTICLDYSQAIYRPPREQVKHTVGVDRDNIVELSYCYRLNDQIVKRLKNIVLTVQVLANYASDTRFQLEVIPREAKLIESLSPAVFGSSPTIYKYVSQEDLDTFLIHHIQYLAQAFSQDELVVTAFFSEIYKYPQEALDYNKEILPQQTHDYYRYIYTLKGLEWKAGIVILDDVICSLLNLNRSLFSSQMPDGFRGSQENVKRMFNLLYVSLSRFRDYLCICYPANYALILDGIFE